MIGGRPIEEIQASNQPVLAAIIDPAPKVAERARQAGVPLRAGLADCRAQDEPDGVVLATPNLMHAGQPLECEPQPG